MGFGGSVPSYWSIWVVRLRRQRLVRLFTRLALGLLGGHTVALRRRLVLPLATMVCLVNIF